MFMCESVFPMVIHCSFQVLLVGLCLIGWLCLHLIYWALVKLFSLETLCEIVGFIF